MKLLQRVASRFVIVGVASVATSAAADTAPPKHVNVALEGTPGVVLEECPRDADERMCKYVCTLPCSAVVVADPIARHRIVDGTNVRETVIGGKDGESRVVRYKRGSPDGALVLGGGILAAGTGLVLIVGGLLKTLSTATSGCDGDQLCEMERAKPSGSDSGTRSTAGTMCLVGVALLPLAAIAIVVGAVSTRTSSSVSSPPPDRGRARGQVRAPVWARPELPRPANHANVFELQF